MLSVWWLVLLCRLVSVLLMDTGRRKALFLIWLFLVWLAINLSGILAWAKLGTKMEERQTNAMQKAIDSLVEAFGDGTEEPGMNVKEDSEAGTEAGMGQDLNQRAETSDGNTEDAENSGIRTETGSVKDNVDMSGRTVLSGGTTGTERQKASDPITEEDVQNFKIPEKLSEQGIFNESDNDDTILEGDYLGTWCDETGQEAFRLTEEGAYVYIPYLDKYGDEPYKWEIITDSSVVQDGVELDIYFSGPDIAPLVYYINGYRGDYFWSIPQADVFYRQ